MADPLGRNTYMNCKPVYKNELKLSNEEISQILDFTSGKKDYTPTIPRVYSSEENRKMSLFEDLVGPMSKLAVTVPITSKKTFNDLDESIQIKIWEYVASSVEKRDIMIYMKVRMEQSVRVGDGTVTSHWPSLDGLSLRVVQHIPTVLQVNRQSRSVGLTTFTPLFQHRLLHPIYVNLKKDTVHFKNFQAIKALWGRYALDRHLNLPGHADFRNMKNFTVYFESKYGFIMRHRYFLEWAVAQECFDEISVIQQTHDSPPEDSPPILTPTERIIQVSYGEYIKRLHLEDPSSTLVAHITYVDPSEFAIYMAATSS